MIESSTMFEDTIPNLEALSVEDEKLFIDTFIRSSERIEHFIVCIVILIIADGILLAGVLACLVLIVERLSL